MKKHHSIPKRKMNNIDWGVNKLALSTKREVSYRKTFHKLRNIMAINNKWNRIESDLCPMFSSETETIHHLLSCTHDDIRRLRDSFSHKMVDKWKKLNTQKDIVQPWNNVLNNIATKTQVTPPSLTMDSMNWNLIQSFYHQQNGHLHSSNITTRKNEMVRIFIDGKD